MGQSSSSYDHLIPQTVENIQKELYRHARAFTEIASLSYEDFQKCLGELNVLSDQCVDSNGKKLVFAIKKGTDSTVLWKGTVRIACIKMDAATKKIETCRLLNLSQFLRVFKTLECQMEACVQSSQASLISASLLMEQVEEATYEGLGQGNGAECCICLERQQDVLLPCTHSYCHRCIEQWNVDHKTCPVCRETLESTDDTWVVISEAPGSDEIGQEIRSSLMNLVSSLTSSSCTSNMP